MTTWRLVVLWAAVLGAVLTVSQAAREVGDAETFYDVGEYRDRCTAVAVGKDAMADHSTVTTHNNDCQECDIRVTHVPARDWPAGSQRPILDIRTDYPRYVETNAGGSHNIHGPDYLSDKVDRSIFNWTEPAPFFYIDQVPHTFAYTLGTYAIQNEKQVSIGESTCSVIFYATPRHAGGKAVFHMETLTEIALERCETARCAITTMGSLAEQYGFYGGMWDISAQAAQDEAGEALTIADPNEAWMFHILPDDTGSSAVWVAQRVPDNHIAVVANQFVIGEIDSADTANFLHSANIYDVAIRNNLWSPNSGIPFNVLRIYSTNRHASGYLCTRRVWRVFTMANPNIQLSPYTDGIGSFGYGPDGSLPYPFSVPVERPLVVQDIMRMNRDQYEGTEFDMTQGLDAGPFGDTMRYPALTKTRDPFNGVTRDAYWAGLGYQRAISLFRTAYSTVTVSRGYLPNDVGALTYIAQYAPHFSSFVPVYASAPQAPSSINRGNQYKLDKESNYWIYCLTGNYLGKWYRHTIGDIQALQTQIDTMVSATVAQTDAEAVQKLANGFTVEQVRQYLADYHEATAATVRDMWWDFFFRMVSKYRDLYILTNEHSDRFSAATRFLTVTRGWMESIGYWGMPGTRATGETVAVPVRPINVPSENSMEAYAAKYPNGMTASYSESSVFMTQNSGAVGVTGILASIYATTSQDVNWFFGVFTAMVLGIAIGAAGSLLLMKRQQSVHAYLPIR